MFENQIIPGYRHQPGFHCASSAIRNVLEFRGIKVSEPTVIGLGRAPGFFYLILNQLPSRLVHMRCLALEDNFFQAVGLREGDVVRTVNTMRITSRRRAEFFIREFIDNRANSFSIEFERGGQTMNQNYEAKP